MCTEAVVNEAKSFTKALGKLRRCNRRNANVFGLSAFGCTADGRSVAPRRCELRVVFLHDNELEVASRRPPAVSFKGQAGPTMATPLGKRPLELDGSTGSSSDQPVRKAARTIDVEDRMAVLHDIRDSLRSLASSGPLTKAHADVLGAIGVQVSLLRDAFTREQERIRNRPVSEAMLVRTADVHADGSSVWHEVILPPEMFDRIIGYLTPKEMGRVVCFSRAWKAAVDANAHARIRELGLELEHRQRLTMRLLSTLEEQMKRAPSLLAAPRGAGLQTLYDSFVDFEPCVLRRHLDQIVPLIPDHPRAWQVLKYSRPSAEWLAQHVDLLVSEVVAPKNEDDDDDVWQELAADAAIGLFMELPQAMIEANVARVLSVLDRQTPQDALEISTYLIVHALKDLSPAVLARLPGLRERLQPLLARTEHGIGEMASEILYLAKAMM